MSSNQSSSYCILLLVSLLLFIGRGSSHEESGEWSCEPDPEARVEAEFKPAIVTVDGRGDDWKDVDGFEFSLLPALDPDQENEYKGGKMTVKALHDGHGVYFLLQVPGDYVYTKGEHGKCPSVALMFQVGDEASYHNVNLPYYKNYAQEEFVCTLVMVDHEVSIGRFLLILCVTDWMFGLCFVFPCALLKMGGCKESPDTCSNKTCKGHEVDIMHFSIGNAIPGRLYGGNPVDNREGTGGDRFGHLVDIYAWNPHCRYLDGISPSGNDSSAQNNWNGAWWHDSLKVQSGYVEADSPYTASDQKGTYYFEFSRPLRTMDRLQQDVQFTIGQTSKIAVAFWYPIDGNPWHGSGHYSVSCDWLPFEITPGSTKLEKMSSGSSWDGASAFSLVLSVMAFCTSVFVGYWVSKNRSVPFTPMEMGRL